MATPLLQWVEKASILTTDLQTNGGELNATQARVFLRDAITPTAILSRADVFDSESRKFEIPKFSLGSRIMHGGNSAKRDMEGARVSSGNQQKPATSLVTLSTELFKGEVPVPDEVFEDNVEKEGFADTLMEEIAKAVGRDLEDSAIKSDVDDTNLDFGLFDGIIQSLKNSSGSGGNVVDASTKTTCRQVLKQMLDALPVRWRSAWDTLVYFVSPAFADAYAEETGSRGTAAGDDHQLNKPVLRYRSIELVEVPLFSGTQNTYDYSKVATLIHPKNVKAGFHRRVRVEKFRDPREGNTSFLPTVRYDVKVAQVEAAVLAENVPALG
jgi:hypothetical protein